jgi:hypothetical protein
MYGCNRMECRCGAQFCWACTKSYEDCGNDCDGGDDDDEEAESDEEGNEEETAAPAQNEQDINLDSRSRSDWRELDLGREPAHDVPDQSWDCQHSFHPVKLPFDETNALKYAQDMECVKCWHAIHPEPESKSNTKHPSHPRRRGQRRRRNTLPRRLHRADATLCAASETTENTTPLPAEGNKTTELDSTSDTLQDASTPLPATDVAQDCSYCALLVCGSCVDAIMIRQEDRRRKDAEEQSDSESDNDNTDNENNTDDNNDDNNAGSNTNGNNANDNNANDDGEVRIGCNLAWE